MKKTSLLLISLFLLTGSLTSCMGGGTSSSLTLTIEGPSSVGVGEVVKYTYNINQEFTWNSSDASVLEIYSNGEAVAFKEGTVVISALDSKGATLASLNVLVEDKVNIPSSTIELSSLFSLAYDLEKEVVSSKLETTDTYIEQVKVEEANMYENYYTIDTDDKYKNYAGEFHNQYVDYRGIKDGFFYDLSLNGESSYALKRKIVDANQTDYEILRSEAESRLSGPRFVNSFYYKLSDMWGARTKDLIFSSSNNDGGFTLTLENTYLFEWANGVDNDSKHYSATLNFANDGYFISGEYKMTTYAQTQYDVKNSTWVENAIIDSEFVIKYSSTRGNREKGDERINPADYFVQSVTKAEYVPEKALTVGGRINSDYIVLKEYEKETAIDINNILILDVLPEEGTNKAVVVKDEVNGGYVAVATGTCYLRCQMMYSPDVVFLVEVTVN